VACSGDHSLYRHGPVKVAPDQRHFQHADGTPFFWLGDTWWMAFCQRLRWPEVLQTLTADRIRKGFTVIQIVAGLYPDMPQFDPRGANEAGYPWERDLSRINPSYFDMADLRLRYMIRQGLVPCVVGGWGYYLPILGEKKIKQHWRYLVARWGAYPTIWCLAGEEPCLTTSPRTRSATRLYKNRLDSDRALPSLHGSLRASDHDPSLGQRQKHRG
jgi:hypothetical protein